MRSLPPEEKLSSSRVDGNALPKPAEEKERKNPTLAEKQGPSWRGYTGSTGSRRSSTTLTVPARPATVVPSLSRHH